jgi:hypothetical protein
MIQEVGYFFSYIKYLINQASKGKIFNWILAKWYGLSIGRKTNQSLNIDYIYDGQIYTVFIPFERRLVPKMINRSIELRHPDPQYNKMIQQQPGVPYLITPKHIGASSAVIISISEEKYITESQMIEL